MSKLNDSENKKQKSVGLKGVDYSGIKIQLLMVDSTEKYLRVRIVTDLKKGEFISHNILRTEDNEKELAKFVADLGMGVFC